MHKDLCVFAAVSVASGWVGAGVNRLLGQENSMESPGTLVWLAAPAVTGLVLRRARRRAFFPRRDADGRGPARGTDKALAWGVALTAYPVVTGGTLLAARALGLADTSDANLSGVGATMAAALVPAVVKNVLEETAWRGYLTEELLQDGVGRRSLILITGLVWGAWHAPYYLLFLPDEQMRQVLDVDRPVFALVAGGVMLGWTVLFTEVYALTRSIWPCVTMHAVEDSVVNPPVIDSGIRYSPTGQWLLSPVVGIITTAAYAGAGLILRRLRRR